MKKLLEIACFSLEAALIAAKSGANRIEFCADIESGGVTPAIEDFIELKNKTNVPVFVMIRPRGGNFVYTEDEVAQMEEDIEEFLNAGADGLVFGALTINNEVDVEVCEKLVRLANDLPVTFHRAFDAITNKQQAIDAIDKVGFQRILTSGNAGKATDHADLLADLIAYAEERIIIMPGGGVRSSNVGTLTALKGVAEIHSSGITESGTELPNPDEIKLLLKSLA